MCDIELRKQVVSVIDFHLQEGTMAKKGIEQVTAVSKFNILEIGSVCLLVTAISSL